MTFDLLARGDDGVGLAVDVHPSDISGAPTLMLIPGLGASRRVYAGLIPYLTAFRRVVVYDPRGIGESEMSEPPWTLEQLGGDAAAVIAVAGDTSVDVFGASMGGVVAQHLALDDTGVVRRLVLAATTCGGGRRVTRAGPARDRLFGKGARTPEEAYRIACTVLYSTTFQAQNPDFIADQVAQRSRHPLRPRAFAAQAAAAADHDVCDRLVALTMPTLVMHGTDDVVMPLANAELLASRVPGAVHHWFAGAGHLFFHEQPEATARVLREFLDT